MPAPTNISALTAIDLGSTYPATASQQVDDAGTTYTVWYSTTPDDSGVLGVFGFGDLVVYRPDTAVFIGPAAAPVPYLITNSGDNKCCYFPVTGGTTYYLRFQTNSGNPSPAMLEVSVDQHVSTAAPAGSIAVNDDANGSTFPLALLDATSSDVSVLRYVLNMANGEGVGTLDSGHIALGDVTTASVIVYDSSYIALASVPNTLGDVISSNRADAFYAANNSGSDFFVDAFGIDGVVTSSTSPLTLSGGLKAIGVSPDETILYYYGTAAALTPIKRWDLVNDVALSNLVTMTGKAAHDMVVLADGRIVVADTTNDRIEIYLPNGTLDDSFAAVSVNGDRVCRGLTDATVWIWNKTSVGDNQEYFREYQLSDGTMLTEIHGTSMFDTGTYMGSAVADPLRFGNSNSCPFWIIPQSISPDTGTIVVTKTTYNSDDTEFDFTATGLTPSSFSLAHGETQTFEDVPVGNGYSITEASVAGWSNSATVSNGTLSNIIVEADATTTVAFTNTPLSFPTFQTVRRYPRRLRRSPHVSVNGNNVRIKRLQLDVSTGMVEPTDPDQAREMILRVSIDGGQTWSNERVSSPGALGNFIARCQWWQVAFGRDVVVEITTDLPNAIVQAWLEAEEMRH